MRTLSTSQVDRLKVLYLDGSKHACYQNTPDFLQDCLGTDQFLNPVWRDDKPRLELLFELFDFEKFSRVVEIGANTGYFALSIADKFKSLEVIAVEGNPRHSEFINAVAKEVNLQNLEVISEYLSIETIDARIRSDLLIHFNVLHHMGVDYSVGKFRFDEFLKNAVDTIGALNPLCKILAFQMGFNWGGDKSKPLVPVSDDFGKITFLDHLMTESGFKITNIALASRMQTGNRFKYHLHSLQELLDLTQHAEIIDQYHLSHESEFFRRPIVFASPQ